METIRQKAGDTPWYKGYLKALEGLLLTYRTNDDKYIFLPKALANRNEESVNKLTKDFGEFASNEIHGEYDRGYFKALEDFTSILSTQKTTAPTSSESANAERKEESSAKAEPVRKDADLSPYLAESS